MKKISKAIKLFLKYAADYEGNCERCGAELKPGNAYPYSSLCIKCEKQKENKEQAKMFGFEPENIKNTKKTTPMSFKINYLDLILDCEIKNLRYIDADKPKACFLFLYGVSTNNNKIDVACRMRGINDVKITRLKINGNNVDNMDSLLSDAKRNLMLFNGPKIESEILYYHTHTIACKIFNHVIKSLGYNSKDLRTNEIHNFDKNELNKIIKNNEKVI